MKIETIIQELLGAKILTPSYVKYTHHSNDDMHGKTLCLFVNCHHLFSFKNNDIENIESEDELRELYDIWNKDRAYGVDIWCCKRRDMQPNMAIRDIWKNNGVWSEEIEKLKENNE